MIAEILSVGTELLMGQILNSDAQYLARRLSEAGLTIYHQTTVGDNADRLLAALQTALARADIVITTGGLGPTADDITKELSARALGLPMLADTQAEAMVRGWFDTHHSEMTENNLRQASFPKGARILHNGFGTAPGCLVEQGGKTIVNLPGPPRELIPMFETGVMPYLQAHSGALIISRYLRIFGMGESKVESLVGDLMRSMDNPTLAPYCSLGEVQLRLTVRVNSREASVPPLDSLEGELRRRLGDVVYAVTEDPLYTMEQAAAQALLEKGLTCAAAESCTGGMVVSRLVNVPGISAALLEGHVVYANEAKMRVLGVAGRTLAQYGAVSEETARAMAEGLRQRSGADLCVSTTGIAGPDGAAEGKPVGLVWLGMAGAGGVKARRLQLSGDRQRIRTLAALHALHWLLTEARAAEKPNRPL